ncbi:hypothetical protein [Embleya sp. NPDC001921]
MTAREVEPLGYADVQALRKERAITEALMVQGAHALAERERRRRLVLRHPDLLARLGQDPIRLRVPSLWTGSLPAAEWNGSSNSLLHNAYRAVVDEAERRERRAP